MSMKKKIGNTNGDTGGGGHLEESEISGQKHYDHLIPKFNLANAF